MGWQWTPLLPVLLVAAVVSFGLAGYAAVRRYRAGPDVTVTAFAATALGTGAWSAATALQVASTTRGAKLLWSVVNVAPGVVEVGFLVFALAFAGYEDRVTPATVGLAASEPLVYRLLVKPTHSSHGLFVESASVVTRDGVARLQYALGPWAVLDAVWGYGLVLVGMAVIARVAVTSRRRRRRQALAVLVGGAVPLLANLPVALEMAGVVAWPYDTDLTPAAFAVTGVALGAAVFRFGFLDPIPVAHDALIDRMGNGVVVLDGNDRVVEANPAARRVMPVPDPVGRSVADAFGIETGEPADGPGEARELTDTAQKEADELSRLLRSRTPGDELGVVLDDEHRYLAVDVVDLDEDGSDVGRLVTLRDVTDDRRREALDVLGRVLRHNVRNDLSVIVGHAGIVERETEGKPAETAETIREVADRLARMSEKSHTLQRLIDDPETSALQTYDLASLARERVEEFDGKQPEVGVSLTVEATPTVRADRMLGTALEELLENAAEHAGESPRVTVRVRRNDEGWAELDVADDGEGIHEQEYEPLRNRRESQLEHGSGLGLWIVDWIVRESDGRLSFETSAEGGALVRIELPVVENPPEAPEQ